MNPQPVSLDFTKNVASNASVNSSNPAGNSNKAGDNQFKNELSKQENNHRSDEEAKAKLQNKAEQKETEPVSEIEKRASVAAEETKNGEALPESEVTAESIVQQIQSGLGIDETSPETLALVSSSVLALPFASDLPVEDTDFDITTLEDDDAVSFLELQRESAHVVIPSISPTLTPEDSRITPDPVADISPALMPVDLSINPDVIPGISSTLMSEGSRINPDASLNLAPEAQPVEKLMTLNQIKASLENNLEAMAELEIDVDLDTEGTVKEVMRFNDIQLKENQSALKSYTTSVPLPMSQAAWGEQVSDKVVWLSNQKIQFAEIHINPQELGPVEVKINVQNEQAAITFTSPHQGVRDLLEMNVNRLREMMSENGVDLAHVDVSDQSSHHESQEEGESGDSSLTGVDGDSVDLEEAETGVVGIDQENLVDYYA